MIQLKVGQVWKHKKLDLTHRIVGFGSATDEVFAIRTFNGQQEMARALDRDGFVEAMRNLYSLQRKSALLSLRRKG